MSLLLLAAAAAPLSWSFSRLLEKLRVKDELLCGVGVGGG